MVQLHWLYQFFQYTFIFTALTINFKTRFLFLDINYRIFNFKYASRLPDGYGVPFFLVPQYVNGTPSFSTKIFARGRSNFSFRLLSPRHPLPVPLLPSPIPPSSACFEPLPPEMHIVFFPPCYTCVSAIASVYALILLLSATACLLLLVLFSLHIFLCPGSMPEARSMLVFQ